MNRIDPNGMTGEPDDSAKQEQQNASEETMEEVIVYGDTGSDKPPTTKGHDWEGAFAEDFTFGNVSNFDENSGAVGSVVLIPAARGAATALAIRAAFKKLLLKKK